MLEVRLELTEDKPADYKSAAIATMRLQRETTYILATVEGIEPPSSVLETEVIPLYHTVMKLVLPLRFELRSSPVRRHRLGISQELYH